MEYEEIVMPTFKSNVSKFGFESGLSGMGWECCLLGLNFFEKLEESKTACSMRSNPFINPKKWAFFPFIEGVGVTLANKIIHNSGMQLMSLLKLGIPVCSSCRLNDCFISSLLTAMEPSGASAWVGVGETPANTGVFSWSKLFLIYHFCTWVQRQLKLKSESILPIFKFLFLFWIICRCPFFGKLLEWKK